MTKQHFEFLASIINAAHNGVAPEHLATMAAAYCAKDNPRFDEARFLAACGTHLPPPPEEIHVCADGTPKVKRMYGLENHSY